MTRSQARGTVTYVIGSAALWVAYFVPLGLIVDAYAPVREDGRSAAFLLSIAAFNAIFWCAIARRTRWPSR